MTLNNFHPFGYPIGNLSLFEITGASVFSRKLAEIKKIYEIKNFSDSSLHRIFDSENLRLPFSMKISLTLAVK